MVVYIIKYGSIYIVYISLVFYIDFMYELMFYDGWLIIFSNGFGMC